LGKEVFDTAGQTVTVLRAPRVFFMVPDKCAEAAVDVSQSSDANSVTFYDGKGQVALRHCWVGAEQGQQRVVLRPRPEQTGEPWLIQFGVKTKRNRLRLPPNVPSVISNDPERFFVPNRAGDTGNSVAGH
jgi:hypothetical protein